MSNTNNRHMTVDGMIEVLGDLQDKADGRFAQGEDIAFSVDGNNNLTGSKNGTPINIGGGGGADVPLSVDNQGRICVTYTTT